MAAAIGAGDVRSFRSRRPPHSFRSWWT